MSEGKQDKMTFNPGPIKTHCLVAHVERQRGYVVDL